MKVSFGDDLDFGWRAFGDEHKIWVILPDDRDVEVFVCCPLSLCHMERRNDHAIQDFAGRDDCLPSECFAVLRLELRIGDKDAIKVESGCRIARMNDIVEGRIGQHVLQHNRILALIAHTQMGQHENLIKLFAR